MASVFNNRDLVQQIYSFGDVGHREKMSQIEFKTSIGEVVGEYAASDYVDRKEINFIYFVKDCYTEEERHELTQRLVRCHCCSRHSHYKEVRYKPDNPVPESKKLEACQCNCRHYYRKFKLYGV